MGYKFQFVTLAGFHAINYGMFNLAKQYASRGEAHGHGHGQGEGQGLGAGSGRRLP